MQCLQEPHKHSTISMNRFFLAASLLLANSLVETSLNTGGSCEAAERPNILMLCVDDLRPELNCYGVDYIHSPNIDALAATGITFTRHYVQSPSCGPSRYAMLTGRYEQLPIKGNSSLMTRASKIKAGESIPDSMPAHFRKHGYTTVSVGKISHHPGGLAGKRWADPTQPEMPNSWDRHLIPCGPWKDPEGAMHGLANGSYRVKKGAYSDRSVNDVTLFESFDGPDSSYPDGLIVDEGINQLDQLWSQRNDKPFLLAVGVIRPHLPFGAPRKYLDLYDGKTLPPIAHPEKPTGTTTWHRSGEFFKYQRGGNDPRTDPHFALQVRKHYAACVSYADASVGRILDRLKELDPDNETIVVLWGDHGFHLGEHAIWGKHCLFEEALRSPLIIRSPKSAVSGEQSNSVVESVDIFPTLCELTGVESLTDLSGKSLSPIMNAPETKGRPAISYRGNMTTIRTATHRLIAHPNGAMELYDHSTDPGEAVNIAGSHETIAAELLAQIKSRTATAD